eukprot:TRINITY_DN2319_c0_g1_i1.p1 TRINITY_DN2319_c0_g1~~TRINITY_DN2319_c0_g1_i1.p1  ORF type:complete len:254 (-),score=44.69 TRINITY_DN2319_c0_g1_i1:484-1245(-)
MEVPLTLDRQVLYWVFIPLTVLVILMNLIRTFSYQLLSTEPTSDGSDIKELKEKQEIGRANRFRAMAKFIPPDSARLRKAYFVGKENGIFNKTPESKSPQEMMLADPSQMTGMLKKQMGGYIPQIAMGFIVNHFFSGFVIGKLPFPLTPKFKAMLQRGIELVNLDVTYFTSLSYYVMLLFATRGLFMLFLREETVDETEVMRRQMNPMQGGAFDAKKMYEQEKTKFDLWEHKWDLANAEEQARTTLKKALKDN